MIVVMGQETDGGSRGAQWSLGRPRLRNGAARVQRP